jgi:TRAP-type C4-dicarboxylate transport system permease small subunit
MALDGISLIQFIVPLLIAVIFSALTLMPKGKEKASNIFSNSIITFFGAIIASISWFIFGLTWPALATTELLVTVAYLWFGIGIIFVVITIAVGIRMLNTALEVKQPRLSIQQGDEEED